MPLINTSVPNLIQGVSQQPDAARFSGQCEDQENALSSVTDGLKKRPATQLIAKLIDNAINAKSFVHFIDRSAVEKYVVINTESTLRAFNIFTGVECLIDNGLVKSTLGVSFNSASYLYSPNPNLDLKALTVADTTFLLNSTKPVAQSSETTDGIIDQALVFIKQGDYQKQYAVSIAVSVIQGSAAAATVTLEKYLAWSSGEGAEQKRFYRWRILSVAVTNAGADYDNPPDISFSSNYGVYDEAEYTATLNAQGGVSGITRLNSVEAAGSYAGTGWNATETEWGNIPPAITVNITSVTGSGSTTVVVDARSWSGGSGSAFNADTIFIAQQLTGNGGASGYNDQFRIPMIRPSGVTTGVYINDYFNITQNGSTIRLLKKPTWEGTFSISTSDSLGNTGLAAVYKSVPAIFDLPKSCFYGMQCEVIGDGDLNQDNYYVTFKTNNGTFWGDGSWEETAGFNINKGVDAQTLPRTLRNTAENVFEYTTMPFEGRKAGDTETNPDPSFVGSSITNLFFFKNRLGFLSGDNVILSEAGLGVTNDSNILKYNFYRNTVSSLLDSAPIDVSVASTRVTTLESAVGFQENLILFSRNGQFALKGGDLLTPKTVSINPITNYSYKERIEPLALGSYIYYPFSRGNYSGLREFSINGNTDVYDSQEITEHTPTYIPKGVVSIAGSSAEDVIAVLSDEERNTLYIYHYFWENNTKVLSSWSKFTFDMQIISMDFVDSDLYIIANDIGINQLNLLRIPFSSGVQFADPYESYPYNPNLFGKLNVLLDERIEVRRTPSPNTYLEYRIQGTTTWSALPADFPYEKNIDTANLRFISHDGGIHTVKKGTSSIKTFFTEGQPKTSYYLYGYLGKLYNMKYKFSTQMFKAAAGKGSSPSAASALTVRNGTLFFDDTAFFTVKVKPENREEHSSAFLALEQPEADTYNNVKFSSGFFRFPVYSKARLADISLENNSAFDSKFNSAEFESFVNPRSSRYG